jgi:RNA polymerase sigma-70 factor (ECF subfamily)
MSDDELRASLASLLPRLRRFAVNLAGSADDGDELVQAACERALTRSHQWTAGTRLDSWLYRIIHSIWIDQLRARKVRAHLPLDAAEAQASASADNSAETRLTLDAVRRAIARLPEEQRAVLLIVCADGFTYKEAAAALDIPIGTVMSRLARARLALMTRLSPSTPSGA